VLIVILIQRIIAMLTEQYINLHGAVSTNITDYKHFYLAHVALSNADSIISLATDNSLICSAKPNKVSFAARI
jgi:hypothetical protein